MRVSRAFILCILLLHLNTSIRSANQLQPLHAIAHRQTIDQLEKQSTPSPQVESQETKTEITEEEVPTTMNAASSTSVKDQELAPSTQTTVLVTPVIKELPEVKDQAPQIELSNNANPVESIQSADSAPQPEPQPVTAPPSPPTVVNGQVLTCDSNTNPGLRWLVTQAALSAEDVYARPEQPSGDVCSDEWGTYLTCCPGEKIKEYLNTNFVSKRAFSWLNYAKSLVQFRQKILPQLIKVLGVIQAKKIQFEQMASKSTQNNKSCQLNIYSDGIIDTTYDTLDKYDFIHKKAMETGGECFGRLKTFYSNSFCSICSGRGHNMFKDSTEIGKFKEKVLTVDVSVGRQILTNCLPTFIQNFYISTAIQIIQSLRFQDGRAKKPRQCGNFFSREEVEIIDQTFKKCDQDPANPDICTDKDISVLAHRVIRMEVIKDIEGDKELIEDELQENTAEATDIVSDRNIGEIVLGNKWSKVVAEEPVYPNPDSFTGGLTFTYEGDDSRVTSDIALSTRTNVIPMHSVDMNVKKSFTLSLSEWTLLSILLLYLHLK